jgi:hypothetical protein
MYCGSTGSVSSMALLSELTSRSVSGLPGKDGRKRWGVARDRERRQASVRQASSRTSGGRMSGSCFPATYVLFAASRTILESDGASFGMLPWMLDGASWTVTSFRIWSDWSDTVATAMSSSLRAPHSHILPHVGVAGAPRLWLSCLGAEPQGRTHIHSFSSDADNGRAHPIEPSCWQGRWLSALPLPAVTKPTRACRASARMPLCANLVSADPRSHLD